MREILFRGKTKNNEWVEGLYLTYDPKHYDHLENPSHVIVNNLEALGCGLCIQESEMTGENLDVYSDTIGQFTGLTDKNGKRVSEHDVIKHDFGDEIGVIRYGEYRGGHVGFYVDWVRGTVSELLRKDLAYWMKIVEIIGNIHDNPELLGGAEDG